jgi:hypothetical protein
MDLIAKKPFTYGTRRLVADDLFTARTRADARALIALGRAAPAPSDGDDGDDEMTTLRAEYLTVMGKRPFNGWDADTLKQKIAEKRAED